MKQVIFILVLMFPLLVRSQERVDTSWKAHNHHFRALLENFSIDTDALNTKFNLFRDNQPFITDSLSASRVYIELSDMNGDGHKTSKYFTVAAQEQTKLFTCTFSNQKTKTSPGYKDLKNGQILIQPA